MSTLFYLIIKLLLSLSKSIVVMKQARLQPLCKFHRIFYCFLFNYILNNFLKSHIAPAVVPAAGFVATPRTTPTPPPAENVPGLDLGLSQQTGVLTSSMLGRMFTNNPRMTAQRGTGAGDLTAEDTDTSLYDYELGKGTSHAYVRNMQ